MSREEHAIRTAVERRLKARRRRSYRQGVLMGLLSFVALWGLAAGLRRRG